MSLGNESWQNEVMGGLIIIIIGNDGKQVSLLQIYTLQSEAKIVNSSTAQAAAVSRIDSDYCNSEQS